MLNFIQIYWLIVLLADSHIIIHPTYIQTWKKHKFQQIHPTQTDQTLLQQSKRIPMTHDLPHPDPRDPHLAQQLLPHSPWVDDFHVAHFHRLWILT